MPGALVADEMGLGRIFTSVAAAMICKLLTEKVDMGLPLSILWGNTCEEWVNMAQNNYHRIMCEEREWYPLQRLNFVPHRLLVVQTTPPQGTQRLHQPLNQSCRSQSPEWWGHSWVLLTRWHIELSETGELVECIQYESHPWGCKHHHGQARKPKEYPPCFVWYLNIRIKTIKQWPTLILCMEFWDSWWVPEVQN